MHRPSRRLSRLLGFTVVPVSLVATGLFVTASSYSVFNATTTNPTNTWTAGTLQLTNDSSAAAAFNLSGLYPTSGAAGTGSKCITVTYTGANIPAAVKMYAASVTNNPSTASGGVGGGNLANAIQLTIESGTGTVTNSAGSTGNPPTCTGFTRDSGQPAGNVFSGSLATFASGTSFGTPSSSASTGTWSPTTTAAKIYMITWTFRPTTNTTDNTYQGSQAGLNFVWEAQTS